MSSTKPQLKNFSPPFFNLEPVVVFLNSPIDVFFRSPYATKDFSWCNIQPIPITVMEPLLPSKPTLSTPDTDETYVPSANSRRRKRLSRTLPASLPTLDHPVMCKHIECLNMVDADRISKSPFCQDKCKYRMHNLKGGRVKPNVYMITLRKALNAMEELGIAQYPSSVISVLLAIPSHQVTDVDVVISLAKSALQNKQLL
ncbi:hypothetical protein RCL1_003359 [Eukaryota sp. TZLM3-RCL]